MGEKYKLFVVCLLNILCLHSCKCFLIEPDNIVKPNTNGTNKCLSINEFLAEKREFNHQINQLKHDNDQTLTILTEQLKHKLSFMESKLGDYSKQNDSAELFNLKVNYALMAGNLSQVKADYVDLQSRYHSQGLEVVHLNNLTLELEKKVSALENLKSVNQTMNLLIVKNQLHSLQRTASLLTNNQNARNQDFLALYNITMTFGKNISDTNIKLESIVNDQNVTIMDVYSEIANIKDLLAEDSTKVAMTACSSEKSFSDDIVKFKNILTHTGIIDIVSFKSTGKFICEFPGLYFISANIRSKFNDAPYYLKKNNVIISNSAITNWPSSPGITTTGISAAVDCQKNDVLYLYLQSTYTIDYNWSCFTVIKIK